MDKRKFHNKTITTGSTIKVDKLWSYLFWLGRVAFRLFVFLLRLFVLVGRFGWRAECSVHINFLTNCHADWMGRCRRHSPNLTGFHQFYSKSRIKIGALRCVCTTDFLFTKAFVTRFRAAYQNEPRTLRLRTRKKASIIKPIEHCDKCHFWFCRSAD